MSLPTIEPLPEENTNLLSGQRPRRHKMVIPTGASERGKLLHDLSLRTVPSFDFYLFSLLSGLVLAAALLLDSPAFFVLGALAAPIMTPVIGVALGTHRWHSILCLPIPGKPWHWQPGRLPVRHGGWPGIYTPPRPCVYPGCPACTVYLARFLVLLLGAGLAAWMTLRSPRQKPAAASIAIAYELYLPISTAGFGLINGSVGLWPGALTLFLIHVVWASLVGTLVLTIGGMRPLRTSGYVLGFLYAGAGLAALAILFSSPLALPKALAPRPSAEPASKFVPYPPSIMPSLTRTLEPSLSLAPPTVTITPTRTLIPSPTPTLTLSPAPTPVWARINASEGNGALIRKEPDYNSPVLSSVLNGTLVEVLMEVKETGGVAWVHIRLVDGRSGWVVRGLLRTATPAPSW
jgi:hypothetical protein